MACTCSSKVIGAIIAAALLAFLVSTDPGLARGTATGANACASENVLNGLCAEIVLTFIFVLVVLGATAKTNGATNNFAGLAIGLALILIHLVGINYTGTSVNPARSIGPALFEGGKALAQALGIHRRSFHRWCACCLCLETYRY